MELGKVVEKAVNQKAKKEINELKFQPISNNFLNTI